MRTTDAGALTGRELGKWEAKDVPLQLRWGWDARPRGDALGAVAEAGSWSRRCFGAPRGQPRRWDGGCASPWGCGGHSPITATSAETRMHGTAHKATQSTRRLFCLSSLHLEPGQRAVHESHSQHGWKRPPTSSGATVHRSTAISPPNPITLYCSPTALCCRLRTPTAPLPSLDTLQGHSVSLAVRGQR